MSEMPGAFRTLAITCRGCYTRFDLNRGDGSLLEFVESLDIHQCMECDPNNREKHERLFETLRIVSNSFEMEKRPEGFHMLF